ncbi:MAG: SusC/RagA family TonB-linked outer membrane protein [Bacteroidales bacterium]|nr:SusC/RagA family TonB-linked outer membrane protein [Bacteroidales bacterium]
MRVLGVMLLLLISVWAKAQDITVIGKVSSALTGEALPGVNISVSGTMEGVISDTDGNYTIVVPNENAVLLFSFVGYQDFEILVSKQTIINVELIESLESLDEVVVIGYGTQRKGDVTSAIASVKSEDFIKGGVQDIGQLIQGKVAGLTISSTSGDPTAATEVKLRGTNTLWGTGTAPLVIIDGIPGDFASVAPEDIESIDVLKDGSAAAIYGTRGTNGVIIITTKRASGKYTNKVEYSAYVTTETVSKKMEMFTAEDYRQQIDDGLRDPVYNLGTSTDWFDEISRTPVSQVHTLTFQGGNDQTNYLASLNYRGLQGIFKETNFDVFTGRADINHSMFDGIVKLNLGFLSRQNQFNCNADGSSFSGYTYRQSLIRNPTAPVFNEDGTYHEQTSYFYYENPVAHLYETEGMNKSMWNRMNGTVTITPFEGFSLKAMVSYSKYDQTRGYYETKQHYSNLARNLNGFASNGTQEAIEKLMELTANYTKTSGDHHFSILGGYSYQDLDWWDYWMRNVDFQTDAFEYSNIDLGKGIDEGNLTAGIGSRRYKTNLIGFFGRGTYSYANKYLLMTSVRYEAASQLYGTENPWGLFPAVSVGWRISNEAFMEGLTFVDDLKLRGGYGVTGTQPNNDHLFNGLSTLTYRDPVLVNGEYLYSIVPGRNESPYLRWEEKRETNIGLDYALFDNRVSGTIDLYRYIIDGLLYDFDVPVPPNQLTTTFANAGVMENMGLEVLLNIVPVRTEDVEWVTSFNFSTNKNTLVSLGNEDYEFSQTWLGSGNAGEPIWGFTHRMDIGGEIGNFWGYQVVDVTDEGEWIYLDSLGNEVPYDEFARVDDNRHILGNGIPKYFVGWNNTFKYKNLDLSISMRGAFKFQILNRQRMYYENTSIDYYNRLNTAYDPIFGKVMLSPDMPLQYNSYYIEDGDYVKIDNITLGYTITSADKKYFSSMRIYVSTLNTFTFTNYSGVDPEIPVAGLEPGNDARDKYPTTRSFTAGFNVSF